MFQRTPTAYDLVTSCLAEQSLGCNLLVLSISVGTQGARARCRTKRRSISVVVCRYLHRLVLARFQKHHDSRPKAHLQGFS